MDRPAALGPAFDTMTLMRPTPRRLVGCWMEAAGLLTLVLPEVLRELTREPVPERKFTSAKAWREAVKRQDTPFLWVVLTEDEHRLAQDMRASFTQACFPMTPRDGIMTHGDAIIVSQALALGTDALVTSDVRTIDHYEINNLIERTWRENAGFVTTLDDALCGAHAGGEGAERLLLLALSTVAPDAGAAWSVDQAHADLQNLRKAMRGAALPVAADRLENRWNSARDLETLVAAAKSFAADSRSLRFENVRTGWHRRKKADSETNSPTPDALRRLP